MDLLEISRKIWRYRIVTLPVIALTLLGALYVVAFKEDEYSASSSYVLINPPAPPTAEDIARNPALARISPENPYTRFSDQSVIVGLLSSSLNNESARRELSEAGADRSYKVAPSSDLGYSSLLIEITGTGSTPREAVRTAELVGAALTRELERLQASQGVAPSYRIETQRVVAPDHAQQQLSGTLRPLVGVLALGAILLFVVISVTEALATLRAERGNRDGPKKKYKGDSRFRKRLTGQLTRLRGKDAPGKGGNGHSTDLAGTTEALAAARAELGEGNGTNPKDNGDSVDSTARNASSGREQEPRRRRRRAGSKA